MTVRRELLITGLLVLAACGASAQGTTVVPDTVGGVGLLPAGSAPVPGASGSQPVFVTTSLPPGEQVGAAVSGNRVIVIGDSIFASTASRYGGAMCGALVPLGWQVEVDAETGRFIEFGSAVLKARLGAGWDAAVVLLGTNYNTGTIADYERRLDALVQQLAPRPVVLLTVTAVKLDRTDVNRVIRSMADRFENVVILDWATTSAETPGVLGPDSIHLTDAGRRVIAENVALALGPAPVQPGKCLPSQFSDDSAGTVTGATTTLPRRPRSTTTTTTTKPSGTTTTTKPSVTTTTAAGTTSTGAPTTSGTVAPTEPTNP